jgi:deoxyribodipyrimidine photolyase-like uncharacterized protein
VEANCEGEALYYHFRKYIKQDKNFREYITDLSSDGFLFSYVVFEDEDLDSYKETLDSWPKLVKAFDKLFQTREELPEFMSTIDKRYIQMVNEFPIEAVMEAAEHMIELDAVKDIFSDYVVRAVEIEQIL